MTVFTYNPAAIVTNISGYTIPPEDYDENQFVRVIPSNDSFKEVKGIRGKHTWEHTRDRSGEIRIALLQTSETNRVFSNIVQLDNINLTGRLSVFIKDVEGSSAYQYLNCRIVGHPEVSYSKGIEARLWTIKYLYTSMFNVGGNRNPFIEF